MSSLVIGRYEKEPFVLMSALKSIHDVIFETDDWCNHENLFFSGLTIHRTKEKRAGKKFDNKILCILIKWKYFTFLY